MIRYVAGRPFDTEYGHHEPGKVVLDAPKFPNLEVLVSAGYLYPYAPDEGYEYLPPHLFTGVQTREEVMAYLAGDESQYVMRNAEFEGYTPPEFAVAEHEARMQTVLRDQARNQGEAARVRAAGKAPSTVEVKDASFSPAKPAAKKTAAKKEEKNA